MAHNLSLERQWKGRSLLGAQNVLLPSWLHPQSMEGLSEPLVFLHALTFAEEHGVIVPCVHMLGAGQSWRKGTGWPEACRRDQQRAAGLGSSPGTSPFTLIFLHWILLS